MIAHEEDYKTDETKADGKAGSSAVNRAKPYNTLLREEFISYKQEMGYTNKQLAAELGLRSDTSVTKYLNGKPEGDVARLEGLIDDVMRSRMKRMTARESLSATNVTEEMESAFETIRKTNDLGLIEGPSGIGKSCGGALYVVKNPTCILIVASALQRKGPDLIGLVWDQVKPRNWSPWDGTRLSEIFKKLDGANRMIIVDDAHRLSRRGLEMIFAIHDRTGSPVGLIGFDEHIQNMTKTDGQLYSRIGLKWEVRLKDREELAEHLIKQFVPDSGDELKELSAQVIAEQGHARALRKQLLLAREIKDLSEHRRKPVDWRTAFVAAHSKLIRPYDLEK